jgi:hypothetical protein
LIDNPDFSNGTTGWSGVNGTIAVANNELTYTIVTPSVNARAQQVSTPAVAGHKYYVMGDIYPKYNNSVVLRFGAASGTPFTPTPDTWNTFSRLVVTDGAEGLRYYQYTDTNYEAGDTFKLRKMFAVDLSLCLPANILALSDANLLAWCKANIPYWFEGRLQDGVFGDGLRIPLPRLTQAPQGALTRTHLTLTDDDGSDTIMTVTKPLLDEYGFKMSFAINAASIGTAGSLTWDNIAQLVQEGHEILNHGYDHSDPSGLTLAQMQDYYDLEKAAFLAHNLDTYDYYVYAGVQDPTDAVTKAKIAQVYKCSFANTTAPNNVAPYDKWALQRLSMISATASASVTGYLTNKGYCVPFGHSADYNEAAIVKIRTLFDYIQDHIAEIEFITAKQMVDNYL